MIDRTTKLRWRRLFRQRKRQVEGIGSQTEEQLEQHFFRRLSKLWTVKRFVAGWVLLLVLLMGGLVAQLRGLDEHYLFMQPVPGGIYREGILGAFTNANPLYATGPSDGAVARLVFAGLMKYDANNNLVYDMAERWQVDETGKIYTVTLRQNLEWHDGVPLTADDVVFTYRTIQNPDAKSPLRTNWAGVAVEQKGQYTVVFRLPNTLSAFPHSLVNGIVPKHLLEDTDPAQLRSISFNTFDPVGSGPFRWDSIEVLGTRPENRVEQIGLVSFEKYHHGAPKLQRFVVKLFRNEEAMLNSFKNREINAMAGLETLPEALLEDESSVEEYNVPLTSQVMVFFKTTQEPFTDVKVRRALVQGIDSVKIVQEMELPTIISRGPLLPAHTGYNEDLLQLPYDPKRARQLLDDAGWKTNPRDEIRTKDGKVLTFRLYSKTASESPEYAAVAQKLQEQWRQIGVTVEVILQSANDLQTTVAQHNYEALLYGISLGADPDVFPFWHSTQASSRSGSWLNFSEYQSSKADLGLEGGRTREDPATRAVKYEPFLEAWRADAPALALYQPRFLYIVRGKIYNFTPKVFNQATDRYTGVENWMIREEKQPEQNLTASEVVE